MFDHHGTACHTVKGRTHLPGWRAFASSSCQQAGSAARIRFEVSFTTRNDNKESKVEVAIKPTHYETKTRLIDAP
jgi:hypothetical protein